MVLGENNKWGWCYRVERWTLVINSSDDLKCEKMKFEVKILDECNWSYELSWSDVLKWSDELKCLKVKLMQWFCSYSFFVLYLWCLRLVRAQKGRMTKTAVKWCWCKCFELSHEFKCWSQVMNSNDELKW